MDNNSIVTSPFGVQKIGKERSPVLPKEKDSSFNLRDRLNDVLANEKYALEGYNIGLNEVIDNQLYNLAKGNQDKIRQLQRKMVEELYNLGEYQADIATPPQVSDTFDVFNKYMVQLPYQQNNKMQ